MFWMGFPMKHLMLTTALAAFITLGAGADDARAQIASQIDAGGVAFDAGSIGAAVDTGTTTTTTTTPSPVTTTGATNNTTATQTGTVGPVTGTTPAAPATTSATPVYNLANGTSLSATGQVIQNGQVIGTMTVAGQPIAVDATGAVSVSGQAIGQMNQANGSIMSTSTGSITNPTTGQSTTLTAGKAVSTFVSTNAATQLNNALNANVTGTATTQAANTGTPAYKLSNGNTVTTTGAILNAAGQTIGQLTNNGNPVTVAANGTVTSGGGTLGTLNSLGVVMNSAGQPVGTVTTNNANGTPVFTLNNGNVVTNNGTILSAAGEVVGQMSVNGAPVNISQNGYVTLNGVSIGTLNKSGAVLNSSGQIQNQVITQAITGSTNVNKPIFTLANGVGVTSNGTIVNGSNHLGQINVGGLPVSVNGYGQVYAGNQMIGYIDQNGNIVNNVGQVIDKTINSYVNNYKNWAMRQIALEKAKLLGALNAFLYAQSTDASFVQVNNYAATMYSDTYYAGAYNRNLLPELQAAGYGQSVSSLVTSILSLFGIKTGGTAMALGGAGCPVNKICF